MEANAAIYAMATVVALVLFYTAYITGKLFDRMGDKENTDNPKTPATRSNRNEKS
nr:MAG TPA: hypothetical protein [Caudoviricetes sp.]